MESGTTVQAAGKHYRGSATSAPPQPWRSEHFRKTFDFVTTVPVGRVLQPSPRMSLASSFTRTVMASSPKESRKVLEGIFGKLISICTQIPRSSFLEAVETFDA